MIAEEEWWVSEYCGDIHAYLRSKENKRFLYKGKSPQLHLRKCVVEWLIIISKKFEFCTPVLHLAVYLLDIFMDNHTIQCDHLQMVALSCLMVAVKLEEQDTLIPKNSHMNELVGEKYKLIEFVQMEVSILNFFKWDILFPTAANFADYYLLHNLTTADVDDHEDSIHSHFEKYVKYFLEISIQEVCFLKYQPSQVAAACIFSARICLSMRPVWPQRSQFYSGYNFNQLKPCAELLLRTLDVNVLSKRIKDLSKSDSASENSSASDN